MAFCGAFWGGGFAVVYQATRAAVEPYVVLLEVPGQGNSYSVAVRTSATIRPSLRKQGVRFAVANPLVDPGWAQWLVKEDLNHPIAVLLDERRRVVRRWSGYRLTEGLIVSGVLESRKR